MKSDVPPRIDLLTDRSELNVALPAIEGESNQAEAAAETALPKHV